MFLWLKGLYAFEPEFKIKLIQAEYIRFLLFILQQFSADILVEFGTTLD